MISMRLSEAVKITGAQLYGRDVRFRGCCSDSRRITADQMFIALRGNHFDGHQFIDAALERGANSFLLETFPTNNLSGIKVGNARNAMGLLARAWRKKFDIPVVAVTGSNGKTTVKQMLRCILSQGTLVHATAGNLNNDIGVPLTLFGIDEEHDYVVIEMGANHPGEIQWLANISHPDVAVITQCAPAHLEGFGTVEGVAKAKAEVYSALGKNGTAIINADDPYADFWRQCSSESRQIDFAAKNNADVKAANIEYDHDAFITRFELVTENGSVTITLPLPGHHNVMNAIAASACAYALDISNEQIRDGLQSIRAVKGRLQFKKGLKGVSIIDDTYNANPESLRAALEVLGRCAERRWLVLGDMGELGEQSHSLHAACGPAARAAGVEKLFTLGELSKEASATFGQGSVHSDSRSALIELLINRIDSDVIVLIKGSRAMQMEQIVNALELPA